MRVDSTTVTTISLSWTSGGSEGVSYEVDWQRVTTGECPDVDEGNETITNGSTNIVIFELEENSSYTITVLASNSLGDAVSESIIGETMAASEVYNIICK